MLCRAARLREMLGRRGVFLLILGVGKTCWGFGMLFDPPATQGLQLLTNVCDIRHWSLLWIAAGAVTTSAAFLRVGRDRWGFVVALIPPTVWAMAYLSAVVSGQFSRGAYVAVWYLTSHVGVIMWAATVPEHSVPHVPRPAQEGGPG